MNKEQTCKKMNPDIKKEWVAALRSGEYSQGIGWLKAGDRFCCLGVLCDLHAKANGIKWQGGAYLDSCILPPFEVEAWAGLDWMECTFPNSRYPDASLAQLNDSGVMSFSQIADLIEEAL